MNDEDFYEYMERLELEYDEELQREDHINELNEHIDQLEKALDKACEVMTDRVNIDRGDGYPTLNFTKEEWKEWCMLNA